MAGKGNVKCAKCGITPRDDPSLTFHRFPLPSKQGPLKVQVWAKFCYPNDNWTSNESLQKLNAQHKMICGNHFDDSSFTSSDRKRLNKFAVPTEARTILAQLQYEQRNSPREAQETKETKTNAVAEALPTSKSLILKPIEDIQLQDTLEKTHDSPSCITTVENTDICDDGDDAGDDSDTLVESNVCRVCLAMDVKMYDLNDIELREMFQNITGIAVTENNHPILERLCWECTGRLKAAAAFRNKALLSDALLQGLAKTGEQVRKNDITLIKENEDYLKSVGSLSAVEVFHIIDIDPEKDIVPVSEDNDTEIVQKTVRHDSIKLKKESIIEEGNDQMDVEAPITTEKEYDQFDHTCPNTGENIFLETNPVVTTNVPFREDKNNSANSTPVPSCSHVEPKYSILGCLLKTPGDCKVKKHVVKITTRDLISKIVSENSKGLINAKTKKANVKIGGISKKTSNLKLLKNTQVKANIPTDKESLS